MKTTIATGNRNYKKVGIPLPPFVISAERMDGKEIAEWLVRMGAKRVSPAMRARLIKSGNWGMPVE